MKAEAQLLDRLTTPLHRLLLIAAVAAMSLALLAPPLWAQTSSAFSQGDDPLEINAEQGIEWRRDENVYVARGNARAASGDLEVFADVLTAHYRELPEGGTEIYRIDANGNVRIVSPNETVYGDNGVYDLEQEVMVLVGNDLRLVGPTDTITARDSLEYWETKKVAVARGNAVAVRDDKRIRADVLSAYFEPDSNGKLNLERIDAQGNVEVATPTEFATGNQGVYFVPQEIATLTGEVKITRAENQMNGQYAEVNLATGISRLLAAPPGQSVREGPGRVQGLILPRATGDSDTQTTN